MNNLYAPYRQQHARGQRDWIGSQDFRVVLCTSGYTFNENHEFLQSVPAGSRVATSELLANRTASGGYCGADPVQFLTVPAGSTVASMVVYADVGSDVTDFLAAFIDTAVGLPFETHGGGLTINWDAVFAAIFRL